MTTIHGLSNYPAGVTDRDFERPEPQRDSDIPTVADLHQALNEALYSYRRQRRNAAKRRVCEALAMTDMDSSLHGELCEWIESDPEQTITLMEILAPGPPRRLITPDGERLVGRIEYGAVEANLLDILPRLGWTLTDEPDGTSRIVPIGTCAREREADG